MPRYILLETTEYELDAHCIHCADVRGRYDSTLPQVTPPQREVTHCIDPEPLVAPEPRAACTPRYGASHAA
jgi:hypothetical protein